MTVSCSWSSFSTHREEVGPDTQGPLWAPRKRTEGGGLGKSVGRGGVRSLQVLWTLSLHGSRMDMRSMIDPKLFQEVSWDVLTAPTLALLGPKPSLWEAPPLGFPSLQSRGSDPQTPGDLCGWAPSPHCSQGSLRLVPIPSPFTPAHP